MTDDKTTPEPKADYEFTPEEIRKAVEEHNEQNSLVVASDILPSGLPIIPLRPRPAFPGLMLPLALNGKAQVTALQNTMEHQAQVLGLVMVRDFEQEDSAENLHHVGVAARIVKVLHIEEESAHVMVGAVERFSL